MTAPGAGVLPSGFVGRLHLTVPLVTLLELADRPGQIPGLGPVDPWLARDLARAAAANPKTTWCLTVTDQDGHAIGHGCARPAPGNHPDHPGGSRQPRAPEGRDPPDPPRAASRDGPGFTFTADGQGGPPGGYGSWRFATGVPGQRDLASRWTRSPPGAAITGSRRPGTIRAASCGTWPRSGTPRAPPPPAEDPPPKPTSSTTSRMRRVAGPVCVMAARSAVMTTGSSRIRAGRSSRSPRPRSSGPPHPAGAAPPKPPATPFERSASRQGHG